MHEHGGAEAAFPGVAFHSLKGGVAGALIGAAAIVAEKDDERVLVFSGGFEGGEKSADTLVEGVHHGRVDLAFPTEFRVERDVFVFGGEDGVRRVVRHKEEERVILGGGRIEEIDSLLREHIGHVVFGGETGVIRTVVLGVDLVVPNVAFLGVGAVGTEVENAAAEETVEVVEAADVGVIVRFGAEVPFTHEAGLVTRIL